MKMGKKVREYKSGDFIFAKVKGYPAWPARVQRMNGKKYFVYFYGTGETANLPPNMIFDYAENKDKFLTKTVKRRDFNDGVKQIEHDFANNVPLEQVIGLALEAPEADIKTINELANDTANDSAADTTAADDTMVEEQKGRKSTAKTPAKETPKGKEAKTPRGRPKKEDYEEVKEEEKKEEEIVSRSGRKIRPKRYIDEQTEENATLPSPAPKKRRAVSPVLDKEKDKEKEKEKPEPVKEKAEKNIKYFNAVPQCELEDLKEPFVPDDKDRDNIIIAYLPSGQYVGVKLFQSRPNAFKNDNARLQWDRQAALNALTLKMQLEKGQITSESVMEQLVMDLNLTEEERDTLDKERETEEKKSRVQFLKTEMKLIELDTKIKTCLCLERADTELCLTLLDDLMELDIKPLMLLKHPTCVETVKRMRAYVGNTPSWDLSEDAALVFTQHAHRIREQADVVYNSMKDLFMTPDGMSFWEFFTEKVGLFKLVTAHLTSDELLELVHEPLEMTQPTLHTIKSPFEPSSEEMNQEEEFVKMKTSTPAKSKKSNNTPSKPALKRQSSRKQQEEKEQTEENDNLEKKYEVKSKEKEDNSTDEKYKDIEGKKQKETKGKDIEDKDKEKSPKKERDEHNNTEAEENSEGKIDSKDVEKGLKEEKNTEKDKSIEKDKSTDKDKGADKNDNKDKKKEEEKEKEKSEDEPRAKRSRDSKKTEPPPRSPTKRKSKLT
ncbi:unnamed protein product, partial [Brenthis ino]